MTKTTNYLNKTWKEVLFASSGLGPGFLMVLLGAYFTNAINPTAMLASGSNGAFQTISSAIYILPLVFPVLWMVARIFDGVIDVPLAALTDRLAVKTGNRRITIVVSFVPMVIAYAMCWFMVGGENQMINTIWIFFWSLVFFSAYTMAMISFYGSLSTMCSSEPQRLRVGSYKAFFDTIVYCIVYALVPLILSESMRIDRFALYCLPMMLTILIPVFIFKEKNKVVETEKPVKLLESVKITMKNKPFRNWLLVNCCSFFGLQMFLVAMNAMIVGGMGFSGWQMAILNTAAFAPVPLMIYLFNKVKQAKGIRFAFQISLISFGICILCFDFASLYIMGANNVMWQFIVAIAGGIIGSWAIGSFFMMPYTVPAQIASVQQKLAGKNNSAMFFAAQALFTSLAGALAANLIYENIKMLFISKEASGVVWAQTIGGENGAAALLGGVAESSVFNLGTLLVPIFVFAFCMLGFILSFRMPRDYSVKELAKQMGLEEELKKHPELIGEDAGKAAPDAFGINIALYILTGGIFGYVWQWELMQNVHKRRPLAGRLVWFLLSIFVPPLFMVTMFLMHRNLLRVCAEQGVRVKNLSWLSFLCFVPPLSIIPLMVVDRQLKALKKATTEPEEAPVETAIEAATV